jgi:putative two-component system response regulator
MPEMSGFDLTEKVRSDLLLRHVPVILVTALDSMEDQAHGADVLSGRVHHQGRVQRRSLDRCRPELRLSLRPAEPATAQRPGIPHR